MKNDNTFLNMPRELDSVRRCLRRPSHAGVLTVLVLVMHRPDTALVQEIDVIDKPVASDHPVLTADLSVVPQRAARWWKGNLHTHSLWSDGNDFPEMIADWYQQRGYHFLALSDHNILSEGPCWMKLSTIESRNGKTALPKYFARFGKDWVETRGSRSDDSFEVRLKPLCLCRRCSTAARILRC